MKNKQRAVFVDLIGEENFLGYIDDANVHAKRLMKRDRSRKPVSGEGLK